MAMKYLESVDGARHVSTVNPYSEFYFGRNVAEQIPVDLPRIEKIIHEGGFQYRVVDFMSHRVLAKGTREFIQEKCTPIAHIRNEIGDNYWMLVESLGYRHFLPNYIKDALNDEHSGYIEIYRSSDFLDALSREN